MPDLIQVDESSSDYVLSFVFPLIDKAISAKLAPAPGP